jgi:hypothetical protein
MNNKQHCVPFVLYLFLRRKNKHLDDYTCVLCTNGHEETSFHLFFECPFSVTVGAPLLQPLDMIIQARRDFGSHIFTEIFITTWTIWNARNGFIFYNKATSLTSWRIAFKEELGLVCTKA